ncbi:MAG: 50S ribosomal protein L1 [Chitinophagales bacterium]|nr:50S ribosomal protein L1 [Chitinophagales bacterium]OJV29904.1 MAG: 50S ribosomal protein L1 [Bacteroidetes bacterium 37-13]HRP39054.1 50S ribosomal protein L1 [Chitinophagales bacterium]
MKVTKKRKAVAGKVDKDKLYSLEAASSLVKEVNTAKFDASVDLHISLGVDPKKADQAIRGTTALPHGTGKTKRVLVLTTADKEQEAKAAGADFVGLEEFVQKIEGGWMEFDVVIATPNVMAKIAKIGKILGPRNLMPNPKSGTVTPEVGKAVEEVKKGKIAFKVDKFGIVHTSIGRVSFSPSQINENASALLVTLSKMKPATAKGIYFKSISMASTMSPGISVDYKTVAGI